jgi:hypothetical protein
MEQKLFEEEGLNMLIYRPASGQRDKSIQNFYDCKHSFIAGIEWYKEYLKIIKMKTFSNTSKG